MSQEILIASPKYGSEKNYNNSERSKEKVHQELSFLQVFQNDGIFTSKQIREEKKRAGNFKL